MNQSQSKVRANEQNLPVASWTERNLKQDARGPAGYFPPQISSKKTTGQQICSLLTLFNIPIYEVCRKFDKNFIKTLKFGKFRVFRHFRFEFDIFFI